MFISAKFITPEHDSICATGEDGTEFFVPVHRANKDYLIITEGDSTMELEPLEIEPYAPQALSEPPPDADANENDAAG